VTVVLCYEALFPGPAARRRAPDSVAILNLADDGWVAGEAATQQLTDAARFRAIEQRLPLVRVAHGGLSAAFDAFGRPLLTLPPDTFAHATLTVAPSPPPTRSERAALLALPLLAGSGVWWLADARRRERR
jgi:apolipoprotein N-acyltransferase